MGNKRKWRSLLLVGLALLLVSPVVGCGQQVPTTPTSQEAYQEGYQAGFTDGYDEGYTKGKDVGLKEGPAQSGAGTVIPPSTTTESSAGTETSEADLPAGAISWDEAKGHIGDRTTVYGPVISATYASSTKGQPTFLNIGKPYPDPARFTVLIWGSDRSKFSPAPEIQYKGKTIYVYGLIEEYPKGSGSAEIIVTSPDQIQVQ